MPNGTVPKKWHLKLYEKVHILTGYCKHLKEYTKLISKEFVNFKCLKKIKTKFWENRHIMKKVQFLGIICWYICDLQKISILFKILLEMAYFLNFFPYRKGALCVWCLPWTSHMEFSTLKGDYVTWQCDVCTKPMVPYLQFIIFFTFFLSKRFMWVKT